jgi:hypothetical protein
MRSVTSASSSDNSHAGLSESPVIPLNIGENSMENNAPRHNAIVAIHVVPCKQKNHECAIFSLLTPKELSYDSLNDDGEDRASTEQQQKRCKTIHEERWHQSFEELLQFQNEHGHAAVPHTYPPNPALANWVKRQRRQYKLLREKKKKENDRHNDTTTIMITTERINLLNTAGFVWDAHQLHWRDKLDLLRMYHRKHGHCNVPANYRNKKLATWVKCQRRQYKLYWEGKSSSMVPERIIELEKVGFQWEMIRPSNSARRPGAA